MDEEKFLQELHEREGLCNHCGKHDCAGRQSGSTLPPRLSTENVLAAAKAAALASGGGRIFVDGKMDVKVLAAMHAACVEAGREDDLLVINYA
jgi:hypothetical protein